MDIGVDMYVNLLYRGGQGTTSPIIAEAIAKALTGYRLQPFPTSPENPWRIGAANFAKLVNKALEYAGNVPSRQEIAAALLTRGYTTSDMGFWEHWNKKQRSVQKLSI